MSTVPHVCSVDKAETCGRLRIELELDEFACTEECGYEIATKDRINWLTRPKLKIKVHEAANLPPMDINGLADAYVLVKLKSRSDSTCEIIHKSELKLKSLSPVWNEHLEKYIPAKEDFRVIFEGKWRLYGAFH